jgi:hypothetical protein
MNSLRWVESGFYREALKILTGRAWRLRDVIAPRLNKDAASNREQFAKLLYFTLADMM